MFVPEQPPSDSKAGGRSSMTRSRVSHSAATEELSKYRILKTIGKGNFAKVKLAKHVLTGKEVIVVFDLSCIFALGLSDHSSRDS